MDAKQLEFFSRSDTAMFTQDPGLLDEMTVERTISPIDLQNIEPAPPVLQALTLGEHEFNMRIELLAQKSMNRLHTFDEVDAMRVCILFKFKTEKLVRGMELILERKERQRLGLPTYYFKSAETYFELVGVRY